MSEYVILTGDLYDNILNQYNSRLFDETEAVKIFLLDSRKIYYLNQSYVLVTMLKCYILI